jgi:hypothetical protein
MKKLLMVMAIAGFAVACNNDSEKKEEKKDSITTTQPTTPIDTNTPAPIDTNKKDTSKM